MIMTSYYLTKDELKELLSGIGNSYKIIFPIDTGRLKETIYNDNIKD